MGMNGITIEKELEMDIKKMSNFQTINETRQKWDLPELEVEAGDVISNSIFWQAYSQEKQQNQQMQGGFEGFGGDGENETEDGGEYENPFDSFEDEDADNEDNEESEDVDDENPFDEYSDEEDEEKAENDNVFVKAFENFLKEEQNKIQ